MIIYSSDWLQFLYWSADRRNSFGLGWFLQEVGGPTKIYGLVQGFSSPQNSLHGIHIHELGDPNNNCDQNGPHFNPDPSHIHRGPTDPLRLVKLDPCDTHVCRENLQTNTQSVYICHVSVYLRNTDRNRLIVLHAWSSVQEGSTRCVFMKKGTRVAPLLQTREPNSVTHKGVNLDFETLIKRWLL